MNPTVDSFGKLDSKAHKVIHVPRSDDRQQEMMKMQVVNNQFSGTSNMILDGSMREFAEMVTMCCQELINNAKVIAELQKEEYDVGISELYDLCMFGVFHHIGTKTTLATFAITLENLGASYFGLYSISSYVTNLWTPSINGPNMNFLERAYNLFNDICLESYVQKMQFQLQQPMFEAAFGRDFPPLSEIARNISLYFVNSSPFYEMPRPISNKIVYIGGITQQKSVTNFDQEMSAIFDKAKDGVVLVSFGTFADSSRMPDHIRMAFMKVFTAFPTYEFIWKFIPGISDQILISNSSNVHVADWVDQVAILSHRKTRAFVTHCGWNSMNEAARAGVPTVGIPLFGDQLYNAAVMHHKRVGVYVDIQTVGPTAGGVIIDALHKVLYNDEYRTNVRLVQQKLQSEPFPAKDRLVKWVEFAAHFPELNELNLPTVDDLGILAYYSLDVIFVTTAVIILVVICVILLMRFVIRKIVELLSVKQKIKVH
ncbi:UDP-glucoronosyl and UDP-glucosyl transferase domain-containing protein [Ditylenchus destructor]|nr:UDP-glucoronosyl and UDP-glucosyl transferase domain-containing protein [Ditylenchus destructor]